MCFQNLVPWCFVMLSCVNSVLRSSNMSRNPVLAGFLARNYLDGYIAPVCAVGQHGTSLVCFDQRSRINE